jgi:hypothetical protein
MAAIPPSNDARQNDAAHAVNVAAPSASDRDPHVLEKDVHISQSLIWQAQRDAYAHRGLKSWTEDLVPQFITNNPFFAEIYARIVFGFVCDCLDANGNNSHPVSPANPLRILELGAGPGKFSFLFLRHLEALLRSRAIAPGIVSYCMSDCSAALLEAWRNRKEFDEFVERGILRFELLDAGGELDSPFLRGVPSRPKDQRCGPLVVIANYVFDSLPNDAFLIKEGKVFELVQTTTRSLKGGGPSVAEVLSELQFSYKSVETSREHYPESSWNDVLDLYRSSLQEATVLFPSQTLKTLAALAKYSDGAKLVVAADKGIVSEAGLRLSKGEPKFEFHSSHYFSQLVNFDALARYFSATGGEAFLPDKISSSLHVCAFLQKPPGTTFPATKSSIQESRSALGPDDLFALLAWLNPHIEETSVPQILALFRLSRWDPTTFLRIFPVLVRQIGGVSAERDDLREAVARTWANHFPVVPSDNVLAFYCGVILLELHFFEEALAMLKQSQELLGRSAPTSYNLGLCSLNLGRSSKALELMIESCELDPTFEPARLMRQKLEEAQSKT